MRKLAILDDYLGLAMEMADWSSVNKRCSVQVFRQSLSVPDEAAHLLEPFEILCTMRERMAMPRTLIERLPNLRFIAVTGVGHRTLDMRAATERGILVSHTATFATDPYATAELTWGLVLAAARKIAFEDARLRRGKWQNSIGVGLHGKTLGLIGLGVVGKAVADYGRAFGMRVIAWSQNLTEEAARAAGVTRVDKDELLGQSDVISVHVVLSDRTRGLISAVDFGAMKPTALIINTARGPIIEEQALIAALREGRVAGAGLDVFDAEPVSASHPFCTMDNVVLTPHLGYVTKELMTAFYMESVEAVLAFLDEKPIRMLNPEARNKAAQIHA